jgi:hypothetical protein
MMLFFATTDHSAMMMSEPWPGRLFRFLDNMCLCAIGNVGQTWVLEIAMRNIGLVIVLVGLLGGCVTVTSPVLAGKDTYMIGIGARGGFSSDADLMAQTIQSAGAFCTTQHRVIQVVSTTSSGTQGWTPQSNQVLFKCVAQTE